MRWVLAAVALLAGAAALASAFTGGGSDAWNGSTLDATFRDPDGDGILDRGPGEPLRRRTALAPAAPVVRTLATFAQVTDAHVVDEESPVRLEMVDRYGAPFTSAFRPQESAAGRVLAAAVKAVNAQHPQAVVVTGDLVDNAQENELAEATAILNGGRVDASSGSRRYEGVQAQSNPDPFYYRPDVDPPRHPGLLERTQLPFVSSGLDAPWYPVVGNHDLLVQGNAASTARTRAIAVGRRKLVELSRPAAAAARSRVFSPALLDSALAHGLPGRTVPVTADPRRRELRPAQMIARLRRASGHGGSGARLDYAFDIGRNVRVIVLDLVRRSSGASGIVHPGQRAWLGRQLRLAGRRWVVVCSHAPLVNAAGGERLLSLLDRDPQVVAAVAGDVHRNSIEPRRSRVGGYWLITTASLMDYPQQARMFRLVQTRGGVALQTWMVDPDPADALAATSRELAFIDFQGGRPRHLAGTPADRNATLFRARRARR